MKRLKRNFKINESGGNPGTQMDAGEHTDEPKRGVIQME